MTETVGIILISYDKFTQCNKDLAEHNFANFVLKLCKNTSWPSSEFLKKLQRQLENEAMQEALRMFFVKDVDDLGSQQIGKYVLKTLTS